MNVGNSDNREKKVRKSRQKKELSFGEQVDRLSDRDWRMLIDLYFCRCMPLTAVTKHYYENDEIKDWAKRKRNMRDHMAIITKAGILEKAETDPNAVALPSSKRTGGIKTESWYFLSQKGFRLVEARLKDVDRYRLSKNELDLARARKDHLWAVAQVYLDLKYEFLPQQAQQFYDWDWYPSLTIYGHNDLYEVRPDAVLRLQDQLYYIELDLATEPIRRSPFQKGDTFQVSITNKLERYKAVLHHSDVNEVQKSGIIAFIVPDAVYGARLSNIRSAAKSIFTEKFPTKVLVGRTIQDIMSERKDLLVAGSVGEG
ncbi:replication-relaxation family protein [Paenibacillus gansuensis]|uniref:Replication-relaxation family protein n=1 Tax=Paenibacillus gansuensis TaxID=306542 RepID=A0ABW5PJH8_9BACL